MQPWERLVHKCARREAAWFRFATRERAMGYHRRRAKREMAMWDSALRMRKKAVLVAHAAGIDPDQWSPEYRRLLAFYGAYRPLGETAPATPQFDFT